MTQPALGRVEESRVGVVPSPGAPPKTVPDVLRQAALIIEERGWCQRDWYRNDGTVCAVGAVWRAVGYDDDGNCTAEQERLITDAVNAANYLVSGYIVDWNDKPGRTAAEVTAALRAAADAYER